MRRLIARKILLGLLLTMPIALRAQQTSGPQVFTVTFAAPVASTLSPASVTMGSAAFTLTVSGANFLSGDTIQWCSITPTACTAPTQFATTFVSTTQLTAAIPATAIASSGTFNVTVFRAAANTHAVLLNWTAPTGVSVRYYTVYRGLIHGGPYGAIGMSYTPSYIDAMVSNGKTYYYVVTDTSNMSGLESGFSNEAQAVIPA